MVQIHLSSLVDNALTFLTAGPDGAVAMSSTNELVDTGFASRYRLHPKWVFKGPMGRYRATTPSSLSKYTR